MRYEHDHEKDVIYFAKTNFRNQMRKFGIKTDDRRRHMYVIGKTGMGKTTLLENMILSDIYAGHGCAYIDPHGDTAEKLLDYIPSWRINDVVYFNPSDQEYPVGFNILESVDGTLKHLVAAGLMAVFKKIWEGVWSARMEYIMNNTILALLDTPGTTLLGINRMLSDKDYRKMIINNVQDPIVKQFWIQEFEAYADKFATEAVAPIQNKVGQFISASIIRNIVAQANSTIHLRKIMDGQNIFIANLSKGRIGEDAMRLLGGMLITKINMAAMERVDMPESERQDFYMYVDEFQNFAVESFASILSEARKYRLNLIMAHQYIEQLTEEVRDAVFGNVGTIISFRVGSPDAMFMESEFMPRFMPEDIINLSKFQIYLKLMIDGVTSMPFSAATLPPIAHRTGSVDRVVAQSRERYAGNRQKIEESVAKWSGFGEDVDIEEAYKEVKEQKKAAKKARFSHEYVCTRCGKTFMLPVELDRSRPIYCEECHPIIQEERKKSKDKGREKRTERKSQEKKVNEVPKVKDGEVMEKEVGASVSLSELETPDKRGPQTSQTSPQTSRSNEQSPNEKKTENKKTEPKITMKDTDRRGPQTSQIGPQTTQSDQQTTQSNEQTTPKEQTEDKSKSDEKKEEPPKKRKRRRRKRPKSTDKPAPESKSASTSTSVQPDQIVTFD